MAKGTGNQHYHMVTEDHTSGQVTVQRSDSAVTAHTIVGHNRLILRRCGHTGKVWMYGCDGSRCNRVTEVA